MLTAEALSVALGADDEKTAAPTGAVPIILPVGEAAFSVAVLAAIAWV